VATSQANLREVSGWKSCARAVMLLILDNCEQVMRRRENCEVTAAGPVRSLTSSPQRSERWVSEGWEVGAADDSLALPDPSPHSAWRGGSPMQ